MNVPRFNHTATRLPNGKVLIVGGWIDDLATVPTAIAELYDPATGVFTLTGNLAQARVNHTATLLRSGKVLVAGGQSYGNVFLSSAELYDPAFGTFAPTGSMSTPRGNIFTAALLPSGKVLVAGGSNDDVAPWQTSAELYDPDTATFSPTGSLSAGRYAPNTTRLLNGAVLVSGGNSFGAYTPVLELYNPSSSTFMNAGSMIARAAHISPLLRNGLVLLAGGNRATGGITAEAQLWNPSNFSTTNISPMTVGRYAAGAALLASGKVLVMGGLDPQGIALSSAEMFDPSTNQFSGTVSMVFPRYAHTTTLLADGRVLVAGGAEANGNPNYATTSTAEVFSSSACKRGDGDGDFEDEHRHQHHAHFHHDSCENDRGESGDVEDDDRESGDHFASTSISSAAFSVDEEDVTLTMTGIGLHNGAPVGFTMIAVDGGSPVPGVLTLILADGYRTTGHLAAGALVIH